MSSSYQIVNGIRAYFGVNEYVAEQHAVIQKKSAHALGAGVSGRIFDTSHASLLEWIRSERLTRLPHKGSSWDRVLISAHHFADQVELLHQFVEPSPPRAAQHPGLSIANAFCSWNLAKRIHCS